MIKVIKCDSCGAEWEKGSESWQKLHWFELSLTAVDATNRIAPKKDGYDKIMFYETKRQLCGNCVDKLNKAMFEKEQWM